jgi:hypothetical protein
MILGIKHFYKRKMKQKMLAKYFFCFRAKKNVSSISGFIESCPKGEKYL